MRLVVREVILTVAEPRSHFYRQREPRLYFEAWRRRYTVEHRARETGVLAPPRTDATEIFFVVEKLHRIELDEIPEHGGQLRHNLREIDCRLRRYWLGDGKHVECVALQTAKVRGAVGEYFLCIHLAAR